MEMCNDNVKRFSDKRYAIGTGHLGNYRVVHTLVCIEGSRPNLCMDSANVLSSRLWSADPVFLPHVTESSVMSVMGPAQCQAKLSGSLFPAQYVLQKSSHDAERDEILNI
jgi:hypothetical protein